MADLERMREIVEEYTCCEDPDRRALLKEKLEKTRAWEHPRVTEKVKSLRARGLMDPKGNLVGINTLGKIGPEPGRRNFVEYSNGE